MEAMQRPVFHVNDALVSSSGRVGSHGRSGRHRGGTRCASGVAPGGAARGVATRRARHPGAEARARAPPIARFSPPADENVTRSSTGSSAGFRLNDDDASAAGESSRPRDVSTRAAPPRDYGFAAWDDDTKRGDELVAGAARRGSKKAGKGAGAGAGGGKKSKDGGKKSKAGGAIGSGGAADAQRWIDSWRAQAAAAVVALKGGNPMSLAAPDDDDDDDDDAPGSGEARSRSKSKSSDVGTRRPSILPHGGSIPSIAFAQSKLTMASSTSSSSSSGAPGAEKKLIDALDTDRELELVKMTHADGRDSKLKDPTAPPTKGTDLLNSGETLSPELALKMARNGHLAAFSGGAIEQQALGGRVVDPSADAAAAAAPTKAGAASKKLPIGADRAGKKKNAKNAKKKDDYVMYSRDVLDGDHFPIVHDFSYAASPTPVFVMLPLDVVTRDGVLQHGKALEVSLKTLKKIGVEGVMIDVWWGIVERDGPGSYDWDAYLTLMEMVSNAGLKLNAVMSFHACGANVGDYFEVKLPGWVLEAAVDDPDLFFTDQYGYRNPEVISLWADNAKTLEGRTPLECYGDFMRSFRDSVEAAGLTETLSEISVGCGPCGELRYPAYPENKQRQQSSQWQFPGIGEFQCYDQRALGNLARAGSEAGHIEWGGAGPHDAGGYNNLPHETGFFRAHLGSWDTEYGQFFLSWYSGELVEHGDRMLQCARGVFGASDDGVQLALKCAGVHWWYNSRSHAAELTAGYFNTRSGDYAPERDGYEPIVKICAKHEARLNFTCAEMRDIEHPFFSRCGPEGLLRQIRAAAGRHGVKVAGENALCRFDQDAYDKIITNCRGEGNESARWESGALLPPMASFTFLRMTRELFEDDNFNSFVHFVTRMANETGVDVDGAEGGERTRELVKPERVMESLHRSAGGLNLHDLRQETASGLVAAQFSDHI